MDDLLRLSPSSLNLFLECQRCFWLQIREGLKRPSGPFPSLPGGMDAVIKAYFDTYRKIDALPPEIKGKVEGELVRDQRLLDRWRNWRTGLSFQDTDAILFGALDDCLVLKTDEGDFYSPLDYKTRGWPRKDDSTSYYQYQMDAYTFLLEKNGFPARKKAFVVFFHPVAMREGGVTQFEISPVEIETDPERAYKEFRAAVALLQNPKPPAKHSDCQFCGYGEHVHEYM